MHSRFTISGTVRIAALALLLIALCAPANVFAAPPTNDDFANATVITALPFSTSADTREATGSYNDPRDCLPAGYNVWYTYTPSQPVKVIFSGNANVGVYVLEPWGLSSMATYCRPSEATLSGNTTYYIMAALVGGGMFEPPYAYGGDLTLSVRQRPVNDEFNNATVITTLPYSVAEDTRLATMVPDDGWSVRCMIAPEVWFAYTPLQTMSVQPDFTGTNYDGYWCAVRGSEYDQSIVQGGYLSDRRVFAVSAGVTYHIAVFSQTGGGDLAFSLNQFAAPANDDVDHAVLITALPYNMTQSTIGATAAADDPTSCGTATASSVWFKYTPTQDMLIVGDTTGSNYQAAMLGAFTGSRSAFTQAGCGARIEVKAGTTYYIMVTDLGWQATGGDLVFSLRGYPKLVVTLQITGGTVDAKTGSATLKGTLTCSRPATGWIALDKLGQPVGRVNIVSGPGSTVYYQLNCNGPTPWQFTVVPTNGKFAGGKATATLSYGLSDNESGQSVGIVPTDFETQLTSAKTK